MYTGGIGVRAGQEYIDQRTQWTAKKCIEMIRYLKEQTRKYSKIKCVEPSENRIAFLNVKLRKRAIGSVDMDQVFSC